MVWMERHAVLNFEAVAFMRQQGVALADVVRIISEGRPVVAQAWRWGLVEWTTFVTDEATGMVSWNSNEGRHVDMPLEQLPATLAADFFMAGVTRVWLYVRR